MDEHPLAVTLDHVADEVVDADFIAWLRIGLGVAVIWAASSSIPFRVRLIGSGLRSRVLVCSFSIFEAQHLTEPIKHTGPLSPRRRCIRSQLSISHPAATRVYFAFFRFAAQ